MKRAMICLLVLAMTLSFGSVLAFAAEEDTEELEQMLLELDYDLYIMDSQSYEGESISPDEMLLLYSSEGYGIAASFDTAEILILQFDSDTSTVDAAGQTGAFSKEDQTITITDEDGWSVVFKLYEPGLEQFFLRMLLETEAA